VHTSNHKTKSSGQGEIFVDVIERIHARITATGDVVSASIDGRITFKCFLRKMTLLSLGLDRSIGVNTIGTTATENTFGNVCLDSCNFHEKAMLRNFDSSREISFSYCDGETVLMNYRIARQPTPFILPFRMYAHLDTLSQHCLLLVVKLKNDLPLDRVGKKITIMVSMPRRTSSASCATSEGKQNVSGKGEYDSQHQVYKYKCEKMKGGTGMTLLITIVLTEKVTNAIRKEVGPIQMNFEAPNYAPSGLKISHLRIGMGVNNIGYPTHSKGVTRWIRYICQSGSYTCRL